MKRNKKEKRFDAILSRKNKKSIPYEQMKNIRSSIQFASIKEVKSIIVTSSESGAGKSFVSANLAMSYAEQGRRVLLADADLRRPTVHQIFNKKNYLGTTNVLTGQCQLEDAVQETIFENLFVLTSGYLPPNPAELLGSEEMAQFVEKLTKEYDMVILDTPPVLPVVDATLLANLVDGVIFVVRSGYTEQAAAIKAVEKLRFSGCRIIGSVLNGKSVKEDGYYMEYY